ncbi:MAG: carbohydrate ABC transporter permease [Clostridia bacterium]|nr:carbohydrate ABC transporter permease [Clostridia bacterium]
MKISKAERTYQWINTILLVMVVVVCLYPFIHVTAIAFSSQSEAVRPGVHLYPMIVDMGSFKTVINNPLIWQSYYNTLHRTLIGTVLSVFVTSLGAYALSKKRLPFRTPILFMVLFSMYFHGGMITDYFLVRQVGLLNTRWAMILPSLVGGFHLIIMKNFFNSIPESLEEAAYIDGANDFTTYFRIVIPLSKTIIATVAMFVAVNHWNAYMDNLIYINDKDLYVLQRMIRNLLIDNNTSTMEMENTFNPESLKASTVLISTLPIIMVYPFVQKYFIKGVMIGSVKE